MHGRRLSIDRRRTIVYFYVPALLVMVPVLGAFWVLGVLLAGTPFSDTNPGPGLAGLFALFVGSILVYAIIVGPLACRWVVRAMDYRLEGTTLCVDSGVIFRQRQAHPFGPHHGPDSLSRAFVPMVRHLAAARPDRRDERAAPRPRFTGCAMPRPSEA